MATYNSYEAAKIANPESNIYIHTGEFWCEKSIRPSSWTYESRGFKLCNPADHCMTVEKFLADGNKLEFTDVIVCSNGSVASVVNWIIDGVNKYYILRAAALEEKKPRTKVEYVEVEFDSVWEAIKSYEINDDLYYCASSTPTYEKMKAGNMKNLLDYSMPIKLYRRIETPMTWKEELYDYLDNSCEMSDDFDDSFTIEIEGKPLEFNLNDDEFVDMCKFVASLNSVN